MAMENGTTPADRKYDRKTVFFTYTQTKNRYDTEKACPG
jgi:hypothetical protein